MKKVGMFFEVLVTILLFNNPVGAAQDSFTPAIDPGYGDLD